MAIRSVRPWAGPLSLRGRDKRLARHFPDEGIGGRRGHAEQGGVAQELAPVDLAFDELSLERRDERVFLIVRHG